MIFEALVLTRLHNASSISGIMLRRYFQSDSDMFLRLMILKFVLAARLLVTLAQPCAHLRSFPFDRAGYYTCALLGYNNLHFGIASCRSSLRVSVGTCRSCLLTADAQFVTTRRNVAKTECASRIRLG